MPATLTLHDCAPRLDDFYDEVVAGLHQDAKTLPCKFFYDERGSQLFDQICELPEYYPTRTEAAIMREHAAGDGGGARAGLPAGRVRQRQQHQDAHSAGPPALPGGLCADGHLARTSDALRRQIWPPPTRHLEVLPVCADYTAALHTAARPPARRAHRRVLPRLDHRQLPPGAGGALSDATWPRSCGPDGGLLIGVDLKKAPHVLEPAYNDRQGVTAAFNLNLLRRINRELGGDFDLEQWEHRAFYNELAGRIEMHLLSLRDQTVRIGDSGVRLRGGRDDLDGVFVQVQPGRICRAGGPRRVGRGAGLDGRRAALQRPVPHPEVGAWLPARPAPYDAGRRRSMRRHSRASAPSS